jgi:hypothetical protein
LRGGQAFQNAAPSRRNFLLRADVLAEHRSHANVQGVGDFFRAQ